MNILDLIQKRVAERAEDALLLLKASQIAEQRGHREEASSLAAYARRLSEDSVLLCDAAMALENIETFLNTTSDAFTSEADAIRLLINAEAEDLSELGGRGF